MFKKSNPRVEPPPTALTLEELLTDIESFESGHPTGSNAMSSAELERAVLEEAENLTLDTWWEVYDEYEQKVRRLESMEGTMDTNREQLLACKDELEKNARNLRDGIQKQQSSINEVTD